MYEEQLKRIYSLNSRELTEECGEEAWLSVEEVQRTRGKQVKLYGQI